MRGKHTQRLQLMHPWSSGLLAGYTLHRIRQTSGSMLWQHVKNQWCDSFVKGILDIVDAIASTNQSLTSVNQALQVSSATISAAMLTRLHLLLPVMSFCTFPTAALVTNTYGACSSLAPPPASMQSINHKSWQVALCKSCFGSVLYLRYAVWHSTCVCQPPIGAQCLTQSVICCTECFAETNSELINCLDCPG